MLRDGSQVPLREFQKIMGVLRGCSPGERKLLREAAYGGDMPRTILLTRAVLVHRDRLSAAAAAVIRSAVRQDGRLLSPLNNTSAEPYEE